MYGTPSYLTSVGSLLAALLQNSTASRKSFSMSLRLSFRPRSSFLLFLGLAGWLLAPTLWAEPDASSRTISGQVVTAQGTPIEHAQVEIALSSGTVEQSSAARVFTGARGEFSLHCALPCTLLVGHPRFLETAVDVTADSLQTGTLQVTLQAKQAVFERIDVTAERSRTGVFRAPSVASTEVRPEDKAATPTTLVELVEGVAGVAENGQPGLFQVYSIRGVSRHRVLTFVDGIQIIGERRAGVSTQLHRSRCSWARSTCCAARRRPTTAPAPWAAWCRSSRALRGLTLSTRLGRLRRRDLADDRLGPSLARRTPTDRTAAGPSAGRAATRNDDVVPTARCRTPTSPRPRRRSCAPGAAAAAMGVLPAAVRGRRPGQAESRFPASRITNYPREEHLLAKIAVVADAGWSADLWAPSQQPGHRGAAPRRNVRDGRQRGLRLRRRRAVELDAAAARRRARRHRRLRLVRPPRRARRRARGGPGDGDVATARTLDGEEDEAAAFGTCAGAGAAPRSRPAAA